MEDPVSEIAEVIHNLTTTAPSKQLKALNSYFIPSASFVHPFCRTGAWDLGNGWNSRWAISRIYLWYKILSPHIVLDVTSVAYDSSQLILYVSIHQIFKIVYIPFHRSDVVLVSKLSLVRSADQKYYIAKQEDLYPTTEFLKFLYFGLWIFWLACQFVATLVCVVASAIFSPITWLEQQRAIRSGA